MIKEKNNVPSYQLVHCHYEKDDPANPGQKTIETVVTTAKDYLGIMSARVEASRQEVESERTSLAAHNLQLQSELLARQAAFRGKELELATLRSQLAALKDSSLPVTTETSKKVSEELSGDGEDAIAVATILEAELFEKEQSADNISNLELSVDPALLPSDKPEQSARLANVEDKKSRDLSLTSNESSELSVKVSQSDKQKKSAGSRFF